MRESFSYVFAVVYFIDVVAVVWGQGADSSIKTSYNASTTDWATAGRSCDLLGHSGNSDLGSVRVDSVSAGTVGWIGAVKQYSSWIRMRDCYSVRSTDLTNTLRFNNSRNDVISCLTSCSGYNLYALSETQCYCFTVYPSVAATCTPQICAGSEDFCGGVSLAGHVDLVFYDIDPIYTASTSGGQCMASSLTSYTRRGDDDDDVVTTYSCNYTTIPCNQKLRYFGCRINNPTSYFVYSFTNGEGNWSDAVNQCHTYGRTIADSYDLRTFSGTYFTNTIGSMVWYGVFRREATIWSKNMPSSNAYVSNLCMAAQVSGDGSLTTQTHSCSEQLPFFCEQQSEIIVVVPSSRGSGMPASGVVGIVLAVIFVILIAVTAVIIRRRIRRHIYIGRQHEELNNSDTSSTFSRRTLVGKSYTEADELRRSRLVSNRSYDTTEQELANEYGYSELNRNNSQSVPQPVDREGLTYNALDFKNLKLTLNDPAPLYDHGDESYDRLDRGDRHAGTGFEQYDHVTSNTDSKNK